jgi:gas vesicle protein
MGDIMSIMKLLQQRTKKARAAAVKKTAKTAVIGAAAGVAAGVAAGILLAPKTGKETRARVAEGAKKAVAAVSRRLHKKQDGTEQA